VLHRLTREVHPEVVGCFLLQVSVIVCAHPSIFVYLRAKNETMTESMSGTGLS
jgi:hypothetical protein